MSTKEVVLDPNQEFEKNFNKFWNMMNLTGRLEKNSTGIDYDWRPWNKRVPFPDKWVQKGLTLEKLRSCPDKATTWPTVCQRGADSCDMKGELGNSVAPQW